jgi:hypothetical protein
MPTLRQLKQRWKKHVMSLAVAQITSVSASHIVTVAQEVSGASTAESKEQNSLRGVYAVYESV